MSKVVNHISHGLGDHVTGHHRPNVAQDGAPKKIHAIEVAHGMRTKSQSGADALSGHHASAIDSLTGATVPERGSNTQPGWGAGTVRTGNPLVHPPGSKNLRSVAVHPKMTRGADAHNKMRELGRAILDEATRFANK